MLDQSIAYLDFIRSLPCAVKNGLCHGDVVPAHLECVGKGNSREKQSYRHFSAVPLCAAHHGAQEGRTDNFEFEQSTKLWRYAFQLYIQFTTGHEACWKRDR